MTDQFKDQALSLLAYAISSALGCVNEPKLYGPTRLVDMAERLIRFFDEQELLQAEGLNDIADRIEQDKFLCMDDKEAFVQMLKDTSGMMAEVIEKQS